MKSSRIHTRHLKCDNKIAFLKELDAFIGKHIRDEVRWTPYDKFYLEFMHIKSYSSQVKMKVPEDKDLFVNILPWMYPLKRNIGRCLQSQKWEYVEYLSIEQFIADFYFDNPKTKPIPAYAQLQKIYVPTFFVKSTRQESFIFIEK